MFPDPRLGVRDLLRELLAGRTEPYARDVEVSTRGPSSRSDETGGRPYVRVVSDGRFRNSRLNGRATVRVIVWHRDDGAAEALAALCEALLLAAHGHGVRGFSPLVGPRPTGDPDTGAPMSYFTVTARLTPLAV